MGGLIVKDLCILRRTSKNYLTVILIYALIALSGLWSADFFAGILSVLMIMMPVNLFSFDTAARWDGYSMALPVSRRQTVAARYLVAGLTLLLSLVLSLLLGGALIALGQVTDFWLYTITVGGCLLAGCLMNAILLPILYKWGPEKGRLGLMAVFGCAFGGALVLARLGTFDRLEQLPQPPLAGVLVIFVLAAAAVMAASFLLSCRFYAAKEA